MTDNEIRIAVCEVLGWTGCVDSKCLYRNCQHLHRNGVVAFPEPFSVPMYPNYPEDLNAMHEAIMSRTESIRLSINHKLMEMLMPNDAYVLDRTINATARQRAIAFLKTIGKYQE